MSLRLKIISGFLILSIMLFAAGALSIYELNRIGQSVESLLDENYKSINASKDMIEALERADSGILLVISGEKRGVSIIVDADKKFQDAFQIAQNNITIPGEADYLDAILESYKIFTFILRRFTDETPKHVDMEWYFNQVNPFFIDAKSRVNKLMSLNDQALYQTAFELQARARRSIMPGVIAIISALIFTLSFNFFINLYFISPIKKLTGGIRTFIKTGERSAIRVRSRDEIGDLALAIEELSISAGKTRYET